MSRTYKDRPYWVRVNNPNPKYDDVYESHTHHDTYWLEWNGECDIEEPMRNSSYMEIRRNQSCFRQLDWNYSRRWSNLPSRESVHNLWYAPLRMEERTELETCKKIYNASGLSELEDRDIIITEKHGGGVYGGGYWD